MIPSAFYVDNKVVVFYNQPIPKFVTVGGKQYVFNVQYGVSLAFVPEEEVQPLLDYLGGCCNKRQHVIQLASKVLYDHWLNGKGGR